MSESTPVGEGEITIEPGAEPSEKELKSATYYTQLGLKVKFLKPSTTPNVRTPDLQVDEIGTVDLYHPELNTQVEAIIRAIKKKADQTSIVHVDFPENSVVSDTDAANIPRRVFLGRGGSGVSRIIITKGCRLIVDLSR